MAFVGVPIMVPIPPTIAASGTPSNRAFVTPDFFPNEVINGVMAATTIAVAAALDIIMDVSMVVIINPNSRLLGFVPEMRTANWKKRSSNFVFFIANAKKKPPSMSQITLLEKVLTYLSIFSGAELKCSFPIANTKNAIIKSDTAKAGIASVIHRPMAKNKRKIT